MRISKKLQDDIRQKVLAESDTCLAINIMSVSEAIRRRHAEENVALEDIVERVLACAISIFAIVEFDTRVELPDSIEVIEVIRPALAHVH